MTSDYRLAPAIAARLVGVLLIGIAVLVFVATCVVVVVNLHTLWVVAPVGLGLIAFVVGVLTLRNRGWVVRLTREGYEIQWVRGVGVGAARWTDVEDVITTTRAGANCVVLRLRDGGTSTIPIEMLAVGPETFVSDLQEHLQRGHGLRRLT